MKLSQSNLKILEFIYQNNDVNQEALAKALPELQGLSSRLRELLIESNPSYLILPLNGNGERTGYYELSDYGLKVLQDIHEESATYKQNKFESEIKNPFLVSVMSHVAFLVLGAILGFISSALLHFHF
jgi:hypothetical protein